MTLSDKLNQFYFYIDPLVSILDFISAFIVFWGFIISLLRFIYVEFFHKDGRLLEYHHLRRNISIYIVLGIDFMIVAELFENIKQRSYEALITLTVLILMRTILSFFVMKEVKESEEEEANMHLGLKAALGFRPEPKAPTSPSKPIL